MARRARLTPPLAGELTTTGRRQLRWPGSARFELAQGGLGCKLGASNGEPQAIAVHGIDEPAASPRAAARVIPTPRDSTASGPSDVTSGDPACPREPAGGRWQSPDSMACRLRRAGTECRAQLAHDAHVGDAAWQAARCRCSHSSRMCISPQVASRRHPCSTRRMPTARTRCVDGEAEIECEPRMRPSAAITRLAREVVLSGLGGNAHPSNCEPSGARSGARTITPASNDAPARMASSSSRRSRSAPTEGGPRKPSSYSPTTRVPPARHTMPVTQAPGLRMPLDTCIVEQRQRARVERVAAQLLARRKPHAIHNADTQTPHGASTKRGNAARRACATTRMSCLT